MAAVDVAALYVDPRGPYPKMPGVDWYDAERNVEMFPGGIPVVAHPPCGPWGKLRHLSKLDAPEHAIHAVHIVQETGGVLEHPAGSALWKAMGLPRPGEEPDEHGGYTVEVCQVDFGHVARKRTWLYCVGVPRDAHETPAPKTPTHWCSGFRTGGGRKHYKRAGCAVPPGIKVCSAQQRRRTPPDFARYLVKLARSVKR